MFDIQIIDVAPRTDLYVNPKHNDDTPTVAEHLPPYATAQHGMLTEADKPISFARVWIAWTHSTGYYHEM